MYFLFCLNRLFASWRCLCVGSFFNRLGFARPCSPAGLGLRRFLLIRRRCGARIAICSWSFFPSLSGSPFRRTSTGSAGPPAWLCFFVFFAGGGCSIRRMSVDLPAGIDHRHVFDEGLRTVFANHVARSGRSTFCTVLTLTALTTLAAFTAIAAIIGTGSLRSIFCWCFLAVLTGHLCSRLHMRLGRCNDTEVVFRVLKIVFRHDPVTGRLRIPGELLVLFCNMQSSSTDLHIGAIGFIAPA